MYEYQTAADIAKLVRADVKAAVKSGKLPAVKFSVRASNYSLGSSVSIYMSEGDAPAFVPTVDGDAERDVYHLDTKLAQWVRDAAVELKTITDRHQGDSRHGTHVSAYLDNGTVL